MQPMHAMEHALRIARTKLARSIEDVALQAGVSKSTISRIETWDADPSLSLIRTLIGIFPELSANDFIAHPPRFDRVLDQAATP